MHNINFFSQFKYIIIICKTWPVIKIIYYYRLLLLVTTIYYGKLFLCTYGEQIVKETLTTVILL